MLVGQTGSGKSVCWKVLQASMTRMKRDGDSSFNVVRVGEQKVQCLKWSMRLAITIYLSCVKEIFQ